MLLFLAHRDIMYEETGSADWHYRRQQQTCMELAVKLTMNGSTG